MLALRSSSNFGSAFKIHNFTIYWRGRQNHVQLTQRLIALTSLRTPEVDYCNSSSQYKAPTLTGNTRNWNEIKFSNQKTIFFTVFLNNGWIYQRNRELQYLPFSSFKQMKTKIKTPMSAFLLSFYVVNHPRYWGWDCACIAGLFDGAVSLFMSGCPSWRVDVSVSDTNDVSVGARTFNLSVESPNCNLYTTAGLSCLFS